MTATIEHYFTAELDRLMARGLTPEQETIARRYYSQKERQGMDESSFCGPHKSFPITSQADVDNAAHLIGHADNPSAVKACIKGKAKANGWKIPESWQDESEDRSAMASTPALATDDGAPRADMPTQAFLYAPITRIDKEKREVEGVATSEALDSFKTIFSYEASKKAFQDWISRTANCREMHERKAVGKGIGVFFDDANKQIIVRSRVSRSADGENTWIKLNEGILNGYSVGATDPVWSTVERDGMMYPYLVSYKLKELSYVDNASNPDAQGLVLCRADGITELVDTTEDAPSASAPMASPVERAGARVSSSTRSAMHESIAHTLKAAMSQMKNCGCEDCAGAMKMIDPDEDGDIDLGGYDDPDGDWQDPYNNKNDDADRAVAAVLERVLPEAIERYLAPVYQRQQQFLARMAQLPEQTPSIDTTALEERITAIVERVASASSLSDLRADLLAVKETVNRIDRQPAVGLAPILNGSRPVEKTFPLDRAAQPAPVPVQASTVASALSAMQGAGLLDSQDLQTKAASLLIQMQQNR